MTEVRRRRDPARTRQVLLDAAARAVITHGAGVSLDAVAREAGVSKGGLLHHFPSKDDLLIAVAEDQLARFQASVHAELDPDDDAPGRLVRAYVRASLKQLEVSRVREEAGLMAALSTIPEVLREATADGRRWREAFDADGLDRGRTSVIVRAADGASVAALFEGHLDQDEIDSLREELIALSRETGPLRADADDARKR